MMTYKKFIAGFVIIAFILSIFGSGVIFGRLLAPKAVDVNSSAETTGGKVINLSRERANPSYKIDDVDFNIFWDVWDYVKGNYVKSNITDAELLYGAMMGMVASLEDPYSIFLEPQVSEEFQEELNGQFEGIGAEIGIRNDKLMVISPLPGSPAETKGLRAGDEIIEIDSTSAIGMSLYEAVQKIRGPKGTQVTLTILHNGNIEPVKIELTRNTIKIVSVSWSWAEDKIAIIELKYFNRDTWDEFQKVAEEINAAKPSGIILDMRNNPGGLLDTVIEIASYWLGNSEIVVIEKSRDNKMTGHKASSFKNYFYNIPTVVLINKGSASGSEILAGALQDYKLAPLVGETSFGKGSVQDLKTFKDGSSVKLTIALWLTPAGREIDKKGIDPDYKVELTDEDWSAGKDPQLDKALELLKK